MLKRILKKIVKKNKSSVPLKNFQPSKLNRKSLVDSWTDSELILFNNSLNWNAFTTDGLGRRVGDSHSDIKRNTPQELPDSRIVALNQVYPLEKKNVLEIGCFEGIHSIGLASMGAKVLGIDSRIENIIKARMRSFAYSFDDIDFKVLNLEKESLTSLGSGFHLVFNCGVLYHLIDPVTHLADVSKVCSNIMFLDTHIALEEEATEQYNTVLGNFKVKKYNEFGYKDVFSGMENYSYWLTEADLLKVLNELGFNFIETVYNKRERNGQRIRLYAHKR